MRIGARLPLTLFLATLLLAVIVEVITAEVSALTVVIFLVAGSVFGGWFLFAQFILHEIQIRSVKGLENTDRGND